MSKINLQSLETCLVITNHFLCIISWKSRIWISVRGYIISPLHNCDLNLDVCKSCPFFCTIAAIYSYKKGLGLDFLGMMVSLLLVSIYTHFCCRSETLWWMWPCLVQCKSSQKTQTVETWHKWWREVWSMWLYWKE